MSSEQRLATFIAQSREARAIHASRVSGLIKSIASSVPYEFDPTDDGEQPSSEGSEIPGRQGEVGTVVGDDGQPNAEQPSEGTATESGG